MKTNNQKCRAVSLLLSLMLVFSMVTGLKTGAETIDVSSIVKMPEEAIMFQDEYYGFNAVPAPNLGGILYYNNGEVKFYDISKNSYEIIKEQVSSVRDVYVSGDKIYVLYFGSNYDQVTGKYSVMYYLDVFRASTKSLEKNYNITNLTGNKDDTFEAIGIDDAGRFYFGVRNRDSGQYGIQLYSPAWKLLSETELEEEIYSFKGFDSKNGNFYFEGYLNWVYWGYDHDTTALKCGNVTNNKLTVSDEYVEVLYQHYFSDHYDNAGMINNGKYLVWTSTINGRVVIMKSNEFALNDSELPIQLTVYRRGYENATNESVGTRTLWNPNNKSFLMYGNENLIYEFDSEGNILSQYKTQYPVFAMYNYGEDLLIIEKDADENYYTEKIAWKQPSLVSLSQTSVSVIQGKSFTLGASTDSDIDFDITWSSNNNVVATVSDNGRVYANKPGKAVITAKLQNGVKASCTVTVTADSGIQQGTLAIKSNGTKTNNQSDNNYNGYWSSTVDSYIYQNVDGTLVRVEDISSEVLVETYSGNGKTVKSKKTIKKELPIFGGFFAGKDYNYLVFGQKNLSESDNTEVIRVVKYTQNWNRISDCKIKGANTYIPFDAGSLRMTELDGMLYIHTCHEMYASSDGLHHQANMTFKINQETMDVEESMDYVMNIGIGYVSHSFNQFIKTDGTNIFRVDHGDAYPRGISITRFNKNNSIEEVSYTVPVSFEGITGYNYTGASVGGFELSENNCLIAYNFDMGETQNRNVFLSVTDQSFNSSETIKITQYTEADNITCRTPQIVKVNDNLFLILWEEENTSTGKVTTSAATVDGKGNILSTLSGINIRLSDCQPILCKDHNVRWYVTADDSPVWYAINPYDLSSVIQEITPNADSELCITEINNEIFLSNVQPESTVKEVLSQLVSGKYVVTDKKGKVLGNSDSIGTGATISMYAGDQVISKATVVILGDTTGDGLINVMDLSQIQNHILGLQQLDTVGCLAVGFGKSQVDISSILKVNAHVLNLQQIDQGMEIQ